MSSKLLRILAICIFATLIPVAVVAIAMAATMSAPFTVAVQLKIGEDTIGSFAKEISVSVNDKERDDLSVGVKAGDEVTISFDGEAYDVQGFYAGNSSSVTESSQSLTEEGQTSYSFTVQNSATITIWVNAKVFNVTYTDAEGTQLATPESLKYGEDLEVITGADYAGWQIVSAPEGVRIDNTIYDKATFSESGDYNLNPAKYLIINYYDGQTLVAKDKVSMLDYNTYTLRSGDDEDIVNSIKGYKFIGWENELGETVSETPAYAVGEYNLYMVKEIVSYTADVKFHKNSDQITELTFDVENGFAPYQTRDNYKFVGFEFEGKTYSYEIVASGVIDYVNDLNEYLSEIIVQTLSDDSVHAQLTAVWETDFAALNSYTTFNFIFVPAINGDQDAAATVNGEPLEQKDAFGITFGGEEIYDLNQTLYSFLTGSDDSIVYGPNGETTGYTITYSIGAGGAVVSGIGNHFTFANFIESLVGNGDYSDRTPVYIYFNFI